MNPQVDGFFRKAKQWQAEFKLLRKIALDCRLDEDLKWGKPCYALNGNNIVLIQGFKEYCALLFFKGALLADPKSLLVKPGENTQASRQIRFTSPQQIAKLKITLTAYIRAAIDVEKSGLKVPKRKTADLAMPAEFESQLKGNRALKTAFAALTPGRQRAYLLFFSGAKQSATRASRVAKCLPQILAGKGLSD
ncbi:MAG TPA: DUF1801 domain-containing protein [Pirellulales bacterium]|nr:DUF1801 domain-containing protein [Pirellulales bacterium]